MVSMYDVLKASKNLPVDDIFAQLWGRKLASDYTIEVYTGTLPATLTGTKAGYLHRYKIYGNTEQTGTPTPENPIAPSECGEKTENKINTSDSVSGYLTTSGTVSPSSATMTTDYIPITSSDEIVKFIKTGVIQYSNTRVLCVYDNDKNFVEAYVMPASTSTYTYHFTPSASGKYYRASYDIGYGELIGIEGSTAPETYIPYGYKLPLTSAGQNVDIYLSESQTTRRIKKLVLDGTETFTIPNVGARRVPIGLSLSQKSVTNVLMEVCTHFKTDMSSESTVTSENDFTTRLASSMVYVWFFLPKTFFTGELTVTNCMNQFSEWLSTQYAADTPVTVWYVLATEETGTLNEPLRKIGDYADTIDSTQTSAQIPTVANSTTISWAGEGLAPSQVEFEYERK